MVEGTGKEVGLPYSTEQADLLELARMTIAHYLVTGEVVSYETTNPRFLTKAAVFVTLRVRQLENASEVIETDLRGCIGQIEPDLPLYAAVQDAAIKAATADPRFYPVAPEELDHLRIEISVLSLFRPITQLEDINIGQDGLLIIGEHRRGLLLPEVPTAYCMSKEEFVRALCRKAGLPDDTWPGKAQLYAFNTSVFEEPRG